MRIVPGIQCQVAIPSRAIALLVLSQTGARLVHQPSSLGMVICSLGLILVHHNSMVHLSNLMVAIPQHLVAIRLVGINLKTSNLIQLHLVLDMITIASSSNLNNSLPLGLLHLLMLLATIMDSLLHTLRKDMILPTLSRVVGSKHMDMTVTLVTSHKGSSRVTLSRLVMISRAMAHLLMDQQQTLPRMGLHPAMVLLVGLIRHLQGSKLQPQLLGATLAMLANHLLVLHQATQLKVLLHHLDMELHRPSLAMAPNLHSKADTVRALMGSRLHRARNLLHHRLMDRLRLLDLLRVVMGSMVTASLVMVHHHLTLVHPLQAIQAMASSSRMEMLMVVEAMPSLQLILLKQQLLLHPRINLMLHPLLLPLERQLLQLLPAVEVPRHLQRIKLQWLLGGQVFCKLQHVVFAVAPLL